MSSAGEQSPSPSRQQIPMVPSVVVGSGEHHNTSVVSEMADPGRQVVKRPFLKRGARMPISKIPVDPLEPVVQAIKNPPKSERVVDAAAHDLDRSGSRVSSPPIRPRKPSFNTVFDSSEPARQRPARTPPITSSRKNDRWSPVLPEEVSTSSLSKTVVRRQKAAAPADSRPARVTADSLIYGHSVSSASSNKAPSLPSLGGTTIVSEEGLLERVRELDAQIEKFKKENEQCKRLRLERETALAEANRYKERALRELEAAEKEIDEQKNQIVNEKRRFQQDKDRGRSIASQLREFTEENRALREKIEAMDSENSTKTKKLKNEIARLNSLLSDMARVKYDLELEVKALTAQLRTTPLSENRQSVKGSPKETPPNKPILGELIREDHEGELISEFTHGDGRVDRSFPDGKREAVFPSGLRKTVWPDGSALVHFPNGDVKETSTKGVVVYRYYSTGCVQTTHPDGTEVLEFTSGQTETHFPDGSKEIMFPNKLVKRIPASN